ncbi:hypothetical protein SRABI13_00465 [Erwinia aphidicola]|uniref:hypothetical protein n=1 Tax=Erwinia aphidicola TaxID=68334 RepID=UPI001D85AF80|nr:hypothetical protein [Erwinia aphidicola]CAH0148485.1 hypothetical protein SRABI13_00465 [Erwinia aphidicola]
MSYLKKKEYKELFEIIEYHNNPLDKPLDDYSKVFVKWAMRIIFACVQRDVSLDKEIDYRENLVEHSICKFARLHGFYDTLYEEDE